VRHRSPDDRQAIDLVFAAGVSDRGSVHSRNEDALHLETIGEGTVAVVCDGISSSASPHIAARRAAATAGGALAAALRGSTPLDDATTIAIDAAQQAVLGAPWASQPDLDAPSCTLVSAIRRDGELVIGWVGDSRAYWLAPEGSRQLTIDDSWAQEQLEGGSLSAEEAAADPRAHSITRWLGADAPEGSPHLLSVRLNGPGRLVLCSDGLWNYTPGADDLAAQLQPGATPLEAAHSLADTALAAGGRDNITVALVDIRPPGGGQI